MYNIPKPKINKLILNYFIQEGYEEAAIQFSKETGIQLEASPAKSTPDCPPLTQTGALSDDEFTSFLSKYIGSNLKPKLDSQDFGTAQDNLIRNEVNDISIAPSKMILNGYSTIQQRKEIKFLILKGSVTEAIEKINYYFPSILDGNNLLYFKLLRLNLIEMIRNHKLQSEVSDDLEKRFLQEILTFVRDNLINKVVHSNKLLKELEITMSLLCFNFDPNIKSIEDQKDFPEELRQLFNLSIRNKCYRLVNRAILNLSSENRPLIQGNTKSINLSLDTLQEFKRTFKVPQGYLPTPGLKDLRSLNREVENNETDDGLIQESGSEDRVKQQDQDQDQGQDQDQDQDQDEDEEPQNNLILESKLEKIIKLWAITEQRLMDLKIIDEKRFDIR